jgi:hypothetical protein
MRINAFVSFDPLFSEINTVVEHPSTADVIEDRTDGLFDFPYQNLNVISGRVYRSGVKSILPSLISDMFDSEGRTEANFGVRMMSSLAPITRLISAFAENLPSGSRIFLVKKQDLSDVVQYYQDLYDAVTSSTSRTDKMKRKVLFCSADETVTHEQISDAVYDVYNYMDAYFSTLNASSFAPFKQSQYIASGSETDSGLLYRVHTIP